MRSTDTAHPSNTILERAKMDRRSAIKGGGLLLTAAAAGGAFAPAVKASTRAKAILSTELLITDFVPDTGGVGTIVRITGIGFDADPDNHCIVGIDQPNGGLIPFRGLEVMDANTLLADVLCLRPDAVPGRLALAIGEGFRGLIVVEGVNIPEPIWGWRENGGPQFVTDATFTPIVDRATPPIVRSKAIDPLDPTKNCLIWNQPCPAGSKLSILCRSWAEDPGPKYDCHIPIFDPDKRDPITNDEVDLTAAECADRIRDTLHEAYNAAITHPPGTDVALVTVSFIPGQGYEICLQLWKDPSDKSLGFWRLTRANFCTWPVTC